MTINKIEYKYGNDFITLPLSKAQKMQICNNLRQNKVIKYKLSIITNKKAGAKQR